MLKNKLDSEAGFGIIHVLATLIIASVAIAGLFVTTFYVRQKAQENYHSRIAMLKASEALEKIKWYNRNNQGPVDVSHIVGLSHSFIMEDYEGQPLRGLVHNPIVVRRQADLEVAPYAMYDAVTIKVTWEEGAKLTHFEDYDNKKEISLREDYYRRLTAGGQ